MFLETLITCALAVFIYMNLLFLLGQILKNNSIVDIAWGAGFVLIAAVSLLINTPFKPHQGLITTLVTLWGLRLAIHIYLRNRHKPEDFRYQNWRIQWKKHFYLRSYFQIYLLQGLLMLIIATPIIYLNQLITTPNQTVMFIGTAIFFFGFLFETIGDYQLKRFKVNPLNKGKIMDKGLWAYTRHPNYFGEATLWWGIFLISTASGQYFTIISALTITFLLLRVSGVTMLEKKYDASSPYQKYIASTSAFLPWFKK